MVFNQFPKVTFLFLSRNGWLVTIFSFLLLIVTSAAPTPRLATLVSGVTTGLEVPMDLAAGIASGSGSLQLVLNVHTDSQGNIQVFTH